MNKIRQVIHFEVVRNLKKPSFWIAAILIPIALGAYIGIAALAGYQTSTSLESTTDTTDMKLAVFDEANYLIGYKFINSNEQEQELAKYDNKDTAIEGIKSQQIDVFYYIPANFSENPTIEIYTKQNQSSLLSDYSLPIRSLLTSTALTKIDTIDYQVVTDSVLYTTTTYDTEDGHIVDLSEDISKIAAPALGLALFYILIVVLGNRIVAAMTEEKENRISELILTSIKPNILIIGKIISLMILGLIQLTVLLIPLLIFYKVAGNYGAIPFYIELNFNLTSLLQYAIFLIMSYFLFTTLCVTIGAVSPTAKDANSFSGFIVILVILPIFFINTFVGEPQTMTYILSYFPPSAPIAIMVRGITGSLQPWEFWLALADITLSSIIVAKLATYLFCKNAIDFTSKVSLKNLLNRPRTTWKK